MLDQQEVKIYFQDSFKNKLGFHVTQIPEMLWHPAFDGSDHFGLFSMKNTSLSNKNRNYCHQCRVLILRGYFCSEILLRTSSQKNCYFRVFSDAYFLTFGKVERKSFTGNSVV